MTAAHPYVIIRTTHAGVFAGTLTHRDGQEVTLNGARRIWYWTGAATLSQLAMEGTKTPNSCKFPMAVDQVELTEVIEVIQTTTKARSSIEAVPIWSA